MSDPLQDLQNEITGTTNATVQAGGIFGSGELIGVLGLALLAWLLMGKRK